MKKLIVLILSIFCMSYNILAQNAENKINSATLETIIKTENPNVYQKEEIKKLFDEIITISKEELTVKQILIKIENILPASVIQSYSFKDTFPQAQDTDPKGFFDSYNRALLIYSVLETLGRNKDIYIVDFANQAVLLFKEVKDNNSAKPNYDITYIQPSEPESNYHPTQEELNRANVLYTQDDIKSLILTRMAQQKIKEGNKEFSNKEPDIDILKKAETLLKQAIKLNPRNATAINEMKNLINIMPESVYNENIDMANKKKLEIITNYDILLLALKVANFNDDYQTQHLDNFVCNNTPYCPKKSKEKTPATFIKANQENEDIKNYTANIMLSLYLANLYKQMIYFGNEYAKIENIDDAENIYYFYFQMAIANAMLRNYKNFKKFKDLFENKCPTDTEDGINLINRLANVAVAMEIISGKKTAETIANEYNSGLGTKVHYYIATDHTNESAFESTLVLKGWPGYTHFKNQVLYLIN